MLLEMGSWCITMLSTEEMLIHFPLEKKPHQCNWDYDAIVCEDAV